MYGEHYVTYGGGRCGLCQQMHETSQRIPETHQSRFKLMQLLVGLVFDEKVIGSVPYADLQERRMFGILITDLGVYAAHSGATLGGRTPFLTRARAQGYRVCPERSSASHQHRSAGGAVIPTSMYAASQRRYPPGNCAAPRLVGAALDDHARQGWPAVVRSWRMSEVMFDPSVRRPEEQKLETYRGQDGNLSRKGRQLATGMERFGNNEWTHGLSAPHCTTCEVLVPLLLCPHSGSLDEVRANVDAGRATSVGSRIAAWEQKTRRP